VPGQAGVYRRQRRETSRRAVGLANGDGPVERHDRALGQCEQFVVPADDLHPIGLLGAWRVRVDRGDRRLRLVLTELVATQRALQDDDALGDERGVPTRAVLLGKRDQPAAWPGPRLPASVVQQHQREKSCGLWIVGHRRQLPGEPDRLRRQVDVAGVALVEHQVEHPQHGREIARLVESHVADRAFGPADALRHGRLRHEVGLRNLARGQPADGAQRESHRGRRTQ